MAAPLHEDRSMAPRISLALAIHNHQPVGNFGWVFAEVYDRAYLPMLEALERHPGVRLSLHYTGPAARVARARSGPSSSPGSARSSRATRWSSWAAACTSRSSPRSPSTTGSTSSSRMADDARGDHGPPAAGRVARRAGLGAGPARRRWPRPATAGRSSTTSTSGPPRSPRRTCGAPTRPRTRATG